MSDLEKTDVQIYIEKTLRELADAAKEGISTLIADVKRPIADDVADERRKSALETKMMTYMATHEIYSALAGLDNNITGNHTEKENDTDNNFKGGFSEKYAIKK